MIEIGVHPGAILKRVSERYFERKYSFHVRP
jgi:hypothetical protein